jgi:hypothetical protein
MATLLTHTGLVLFLVAAAVTSRLGFESGIVLTRGESQPVQAIGTPGLLVVKSFGFASPRRDDGSFADFTTDLAVDRDGQELARKTVRSTIRCRSRASRSTRTGSCQRPTCSSVMHRGGRCGTVRRSCPTPSPASPMACSACRAAPSGWRCS